MSQRQKLYHIIKVSPKRLAPDQVPESFLNDLKKKSRYQIKLFGILPFNIGADTIVIGGNRIYHPLDTLSKKLLNISMLEEIAIANSDYASAIKYLKEKSIRQANVSVNNFPVKPEEIKKVFRLKDGGEEYFFFTANDKKEKLFYHCRKI